MHQVRVLFLDKGAHQRRNNRNFGRRFRPDRYLRAATDLNQSFVRFQLAPIWSKPSCPASIDSK